MDDQAADAIVGGEDGDSGQTSEPDQSADGSFAAQVLLSEYRALRDEINLRLAAQGRLVALNLSALSVIGGLIIARQAPAPILLVVPFLTVALGFEWVNHMRQLTLIGQYTESELWPFIRRTARVPLPSWEATWGRSNPTLAIQAFTTLPPAVAFVLPPILALVLSYRSVVGTPLLPVWWLDIGMCAGLAVLALVFTLAEIRPRWSQGTDSHPQRGGGARAPDVITRWVTGRGRHDQGSARRADGDRNSEG